MIQPDLETQMKETTDSHVVVTDIQMPFVSMVIFMVKAALAAIPALFILTAIGVFVAAIIDALGGNAGS